MESTDARKEIEVVSVANRLSVLCEFTEPTITKILYSVPDFYDREQILEWYHTVEDTVKLLQEKLQ